jgi:hypothetical protein
MVAKVFVLWLTVVEPYRFHEVANTITITRQMVAVANTAAIEFMPAPGQ